MSTFKDSYYPISIFFRTRHERKYFANNDKKMDNKSTDQLTYTLVN